MPEYLSPGVYVEEVETGPRPIAGVSTSTAGFVGETERGPTRPRLVTSFADFERIYGGFAQHRPGGRLASRYLAYGVEGFFRNGGQRAYVARVAPRGAGTASTTLHAGEEGPAPARLDAPARLEFGLVTVEESRVETLALANVGGEPLVVRPADLTVEPDDGTDDDEFRPAMDDDATVAPGESVALDVAFEPTSAGAKGATLTVEAGETSVSIRLEAGARTGGLDASPARVVLDEPPDGGATGTVTVTNASTAAVTLTADDVSVEPGEGTEGDEFAVDLAPLADDGRTLAPGDAVDLTVRFTPEGEGERLATLLVAADDDAVPVRLVGNEPGAEEPAAVPTGESGGDGDGDPVVEVTAVGPGVWGNNVAVAVGPASSAPTAGGRGGPFRLVVRYWADDAAAAAAFAGGADPAREGVPDPSVEEVYDDLSADETAGNHYEKVVNAASALVTLRRLAPGTPATGTPGTPVVRRLDGGDGDAPGLSDYRGRATAGERTGLAALAAVDEVAIVCAPDEVVVDGLTQEVADHCESTGDRFAVLQARERAEGVERLRPPVDSDRAAFYYPWLRVSDPATDGERLVPPGGHVAGIYARTDAERGVFKAPANEIVRGALGLQLTVSKGDQEVLNPRGVNCIRSFPGRGIRVWGARTTTSDPAMRYLNVRRLLLYLEESIDEGTQYVVFEPNDRSLWARVRQSVSNFLTTAWRDGALVGTTPEEAFYVRCDRSTMTQDQIDNGMLIVEVGVAPVKPAEFVVIRIAQSAGGSEGG
jgi:hypothetical protein